MNTWVMLAVIGGLMVLMMVVSILPQKKKKKQAEQMMASIKKGDKIKTIGGFVGYVVAIDDATNTMVLNLGSDESNAIIVTIDKNAVYTVINPITPQTVETTDGEQVVIEEEGVIALDDVSDDKKVSDKNKTKADKKSSKKTATENDAVESETIIDVEVENVEKF